MEVVLLLVRVSGAAPFVERPPSRRPGRQVWQKAPRGHWLCLRSRGQQALPPWSPVHPPCWGARSCRELVWLPQRMVRPRTRGFLLLRRRATALPVWR
jgi:hypothetical protein